jgi:hypothetical protein
MIAMPHFCLKKGCPTNGKRDFVTLYRLKKHQETKSCKDNPTIVDAEDAARIAKRKRWNNKLHSLQREDIMLNIVLHSLQRNKPIL